MEIKIVSKIDDSKYYGEKNYPIAYYEVDFKEVLKPSALLNLVQDLATINAEEHGFGYSFTHPKNFGWFLVKYHMEFDEYPEKINEIKIKTEPRGYAKILANRDFELWTVDNSKRLGRIASSWMLIDLSTKSILQPAKVFDFMPQFEKREDDLQYNKIFVPEKVDFSKIFEIRYDDIDVNQHVNNANYIVWAFEALPYEFKAQHKLKTLDITYKKEIAYGHNITSQIEFNDETKTSVHVLRNATTSEELCLVKALWE